MPSSVAMYDASPMVKAGKTMWNVIVKANWSRARIVASNPRNIGGPPGFLTSRLTRSYRRRRRKPQINRYYQEKLHEKASKPPRADEAENADDDEVKRDDIVQERRPQEDQDAGQDGDDGLQGDVIHEGDP
jgi:hypothetical protein